MIIKKGQKIELTKDTSLKKLTILVGWDGSADIEIDISAFILNSEGKTDSDNEFVFYNNANWGKGAIELDSKGLTEDKAKFSFDLDKIPQTVSKIALTATIYEFQKRNHNFGQISKIYLKGIDKTSNSVVFNFPIEDILTVETGLILCEIYRYNNQWKFNGVASGYKGGLDSLCKEFGVQVNEKNETDRVDLASRDEKLIDDMSKKASIGNFLNTNPSEKKINLSKIELKKKGDKIDLSKKDNKLGKIIVNLNWTRGEKKIGILGNFSRDKNIDLDLGCMYELKNGQKGVVQALGKAFGFYNGAPYIQLLDDDRTGDSKEGEFLWINGENLKEISKILIFAFIYEGVSNWSQADGVIRVLQDNGPEIIIKLNEPQNGLGMCGAVLLENINNEFRVEKVEEYFHGHKELDKKFGFGFRWVAGHK